MVHKFESLDGSYNIEINEKLYQSVLNKCRNSGDYETGGILVGSYNSDMNVAHIRSILKAPPDSRYGKMSFKRGTDGLIDILDKKWATSNEYYLGEWHYHPNNSASPSCTDKRQMKKLAKSKELHCPEPILLIIGCNDNSSWESSVHVFTKSKIIITKCINE